jgi:hypothetical protein
MPISTSQNLSNPVCPFRPAFVGYLNNAKALLIALDRRCDELEQILLSEFSTNL